MSNPEEKDWTIHTTSTSLHYTCTYDIAIVQTLKHKPTNYAFSIFHDLQLFYVHRNYNNNTTKKKRKITN
jgi:hypothetical protein